MSVFIALLYTVDVFILKRLLQKRMSHSHPTGLKCCLSCHTIYIVSLVCGHSVSVRLHFQDKGRGGGGRGSDIVSDMHKAYFKFIPYIFFFIFSLFFFALHKYMAFTCKHLYISLSSMVV